MPKPTTTQFMNIATRRTFLGLACASASLPAWVGCTPSRSVRRIDDAWFRERLTQETLRTLEAAVTPTGFLGRTRQGGQTAAARTDQNAYRPTGLGPGSPTSQGRNLFVLAAGYDLTRKTEFLEAVTKAADFLATYFRDKEHGGLFASVDAEGKVLDDRKESYGTAHAILGMSWAALVSGQQSYRDDALQIWSDMKTGLRDEHGLFKRETSRDFQVVGPGKNTQNPMMHLFEALLALHDATQSEEIFRDAQDLADAVLTQLYQEEPGYIPELYDSDWKPISAGPPGQTEPNGSPLDVYNSYAPAAQTGHIEIGHQVEWAFFLSRAVEKGFSQKYLGPAERLLDFSVKVGHEPQSGRVFGYSDYDGKRTAESSDRGWQIAEFLKMTMNWAVLRNRSDLWEPFDKSLAAVKNSGSLPGGYHGCGMYTEALRLAALGT